MPSICELFRTVFLLATTLVSIHETCECGHASESRIIGGDATSTSNYPWMSYLIVSEAAVTHLCGASLISSRYAVTAFHCAIGDPDNAVLIVGRSRLDQSSAGEQSVNVNRYIRYRPGTSHADDEDIALIEFATAVKFGSTAQPICLPPKNKYFTGVTAVFLGFGATIDSKDSFSYQLKEGQGKVPSNQNCNKALRRIGGAVTNHQICAGTYNGSPSTCYGDSGGPLMYFDTTKQVWELIGVTAKTFSCSNPKGYGIFTRVSHYVDWIQQATSYTSCQK